MRNLVVYHSHTGTTRDVAKKAAKSLAADVAEVHATRYGPGMLGYISAAFDSWKGRLPEIDVSGQASEQYDFVILMAPVWVGHASTPLRAYLSHNRSRFKRAAFVLTCGGHCPPSAFDEMEHLAGVKPEATFILRENEIKRAAALPSELASFLSAMRQKQSA
jgi:flavodoxin